MERLRQSGRVLLIAVFLGDHSTCHTQLRTQTERWMTKRGENGFKYFVPASGILWETSHQCQVSDSFHHHFWLSGEPRAGREWKGVSNCCFLRRGTRTP